MLSLKKLSEEANHQPRILYPEDILLKKEGEAKTRSGAQNLERTLHKQTSIQKVKGICSRFHLVQVQETLESKKSGKYVDK